MGDILARLRPEARFLLLVGRPETTSKNLLAAISSTFAWGVLAALATRERAVTAVYDQLQRLPGGVPAPVLAWFRAGAMVAEFASGCLEQSLHDAVRVLTGSGIDVMLLKGAALAVTAYPTFASRGMQDVDLLVHPHQADRAWRALLEAGWVRQDPRVEIDAFYADHHHLPRLAHPRRAGAKLELHTGLFHRGGPFALTVEDLFAQGRTVDVDGCLVRVPSGEHMLLHVCLHFAWSHGMRFGAWRTFRDLAALSHASHVPGPAFPHLAHAARGATSCYWTLRLGATIGGIHTPGVVLEALRPPSPRWVLDLLARHYMTVAMPAAASCPSMRLDHALWRLGFQPGRSGHGTMLPWSAGQDWAVVSPVSSEDRGPTVRGRLEHGWGLLKYGHTLFRG